MRTIRMTVVGDQVSLDSPAAGVQGSGNVDTLVVSFDPSWDGFAKTATWWDALGQNPVKRILTADLLDDLSEATRRYLLPIPAEPLARAGTCQLVIDGYRTGQRARSVCAELEVLAAPEAADAVGPADPTPSQAEQLQGQVENLLAGMSAVAGEAKTARTEAQNARNEAQSARNEAQTAKTAAEQAAGLASAERAAAAAWCAAARTAKEDAASAAEAAQAACAAAEAVAVKTPFVGENGNWMTWDAQAGAFVDSGLPARGETGPQGEPGPQGPQGEPGAPGTDPGTESALARQSFLFDMVARGEVVATERPVAGQVVPAGETAELTLDAGGEADLGVWTLFTDALLRHWSSSAGDTASLPALVARMGDEEFFNNVLKLRVSDGTAQGIPRLFTAGEFLTLAPQLKTALLKSTRGKNKEFFNKKGTTMILAPTWAELQYLLFHYTAMGSNNTMPTRDECQALAADYPWAPAEAELHRFAAEEPLDESRVTWQAFFSAATDYVFGWDNTAMDAIAQIGVSVLNDDFHLRKNAAGDRFESFSELYDGSTGDVLRDVIALFFQVNRASDFTTNNSSFNVRVPTWAEVQYVLIHYAQLNSSRILPAAGTILLEAVDDYDWRYAWETVRHFAPGGEYRVTVTVDGESRSETVVCTGQSVTVNGVTVGLAAGTAENGSDRDATVDIDYLRAVAAGGSVAELRRTLDKAQTRIGQLLAALEGRVAALEAAGEASGA